MSPCSSVQRFFYYWCKTTWNWPISLKKSPVFPWVQVQGSQKPNLPHFPRLQGKMTVQTFLWVAIESCICPGSPQGMADDRCINMFVFHGESGNKTLSNVNEWISYLVFLCPLLSKLTGFRLVTLCSSGWTEDRKFSDLNEVVWIIAYSLFGRGRSGYQILRIGWYCFFISIRYRVRFWHRYRNCDVIELSGK